MRTYCKLLTLCFLALSFHLLAVASSPKMNAAKNPHIDQQTEALFRNLHKLSQQGKTMFGVANATTISYKDRLKNSNLENSDVKEITGSNPAIIESDFMWYNDPTFMKTDIEAMKLAYKRGAVVAYCWHLRGLNSHNFYAKDKDGKLGADKDLVKQIVAGGSRESNASLHWFYSLLDTLVVPVFNELAFPVIFRPWHEMNGGWFWWGSETCTPTEYQTLYRITVDYIRSKGVRNVLYAWSPDTYTLLEYYPGNEYVDIVGLDIYEPGIEPLKPKAKMVAEIEKLIDFAAENGKVAAMTETGCRKEGDEFTYPNKYPDFWSNYVLDILQTNAKTKRMVWVLAWYSSDWARNRTSQFYVPYKGIETDQPKGQEAIDDFIKFYNHPATVFEKDLPKMYK